MKLWDKIKQMLGINQPKQLQAPQQYTTPISTTAKTKSNTIQIIKF